MSKQWPFDDPPKPSNDYQGLLVVLLLAVVVMLAYLCLRGG